MIGHTFRELRELSDEELIAAHDGVAGSTSVGLNYYLNELQRREAVRQSDRIEQMTRTMVTCTMWITVLTLVVTIATILSLVVAVAHLSF